MLNFWYRDCSNCANEFPYINRVYADYKDDIEILAINDYYSDTEQIVKSYPEFLGEDLQMPLFKVGNGEDDLTLTRFESEGYPTSVVIDRYGVVTMIEVGAVLGESKWQNIFDYFIGDDYKQVLIDDPSMLNPKIEPTVQWTDSSASEIAEAFNSGDINVKYYPETGADAKYSWPFIADTYNGESVVRPSNSGIDNSYAILYAEGSLKPGQAIMFDWLASTQNTNMGADVLYVLVDGKDIYSIAGISEDGYEVCCTYVDPRPVTESNKDVVATYEVAFAFYKDNVDKEGDDTVSYIGKSTIQRQEYLLLSLKPIRLPISRRSSHNCLRTFMASGPQRIRIRSPAFAFIFSFSTMPYMMPKLMALAFLRSSTVT